MKEGSNFDNSIIVRFLMNEASEADIQLLENWILSEEVNRSYFDQIQKTWNSVTLEKELDNTKINQDFQKILDHAGDLSINTKNIYRLRNIIQSWVFKGAAIFILGFTASWFIWNNSTSIVSDTTALNIVETPRGSRATIVLPDGSKVLLNAESKLSYPQKFTSNERHVALEGEAFFEIEKDAGRQFLVKTPEITVKVFGTSFNVKSYPDENTTETTLVEGSISIYKNSINGSIEGTELKMEPNQRMVLYKEQKKSTPTISKEEKIENVPARKAKLVLSKRIDTDRFISWKDGQLKITSEPMKNLAVTLERRYDVKIHFEDENTKQYRFTGTFENETIEQVMAAIKLASPISYRIEEREIWISNKVS